MRSLKGIMSLTYTPLNKDYSLNEDSVRREIDGSITGLLKKKVTPIYRV